jgi:hypothetical protein
VTPCDETDQSEEQTNKMEEPKKVDSQKQNEMLELEQVDDEQKKEAVEEKKEAVTKPLQASQTEPMKNVINKEDSKESDEKLQKSLQLALKIRNKENKLKDIKFTFMCGSGKQLHFRIVSLLTCSVFSDTADGISEELVAAGLVTPPNKDAGRARLCSIDGRLNFKNDDTNNGQNGGTQNDGINGR